VSYVLPEAPVDRATYFRDVEKQLRDHLLRTRTTEVHANPDLKLYSRVGEGREEFLARCRAAAEESAEQEAAKLRDRYQQKLERLRTQQRTAEDRVRELTVDTRTRVQQEVIAGAGQLLNVFLGGRARLGSLSGAASRRSTTRRTQERLDTARGKVDDVAGDITELEAELAEELAEIRDRWQDRAGTITARTVPLEQSDVRVEEVVLLWLPT
jgi:hypothetical protein